MARAYKKKPIPVIKDTYLAMIRNSVRSNLFRNYYLSINGKTIDDTRDGDLSCALFVSSILTLLKLTEETRLFVDEVVVDLKASGWKETMRPEEGSVLVWEARKGDRDEVHKHIGFYIGDDRAVSNRPDTRQPTEHHWTFDGTRKVTAIFSKEM